MTLNAKHVPGSPNKGEVRRTAGLGGLVPGASASNDPGARGANAGTPTVAAYAGSNTSVWFSGIKTALRRFLYIAAPVVIWIIICRVNLVSLHIAQVGTAWFTIFLYLLAMPMSIFLRMDPTFSEWSKQYASLTVLLIGLAVVLLNFLCVAAVCGGLKALKRE